MVAVDAGHGMHAPVDVHKTIVQEIVLHLVEMVAILLAVLVEVVLLVNLAAKVVVLMGVLEVLVLLDVKILVQGIALQTVKQDVPEGVNLDVKVTALIAAILHVM